MERRRYQSVLAGDVRLPAAVVKDPNATVRSGSKSAARRRVWFDAPLLMVLIALLFYGIVMVYSASYDYSYNWYGDNMTIFLRQLMWMGVGLAVMAFLTWMDYHTWTRFAVIALVVTLGMLFAVWVMGITINNASRTLLGGSVQPSELAKAVVVFYLAVWLYAKRDSLQQVGFGLLPLGAILGMLGGLILLQPDLSAFLTVMILGGLMFFLAGGDMKQIGLLLIIALVVGILLVTFTNTGSARMAAYLDGIRNPVLGSDHVRRSFEAFVRGGLFGVGIGNGEVKLTGLPVPHTDSIFAVVGEETGLAGSLALVGLYVLLLWRGLHIARFAPDQLGRLLAAGFTLWITLEAFVNMSVMLNLLPFAGNPLPFITSGGSNLVISMAAVGIILSVSRQSVKKQDQEASLFNAVVNLRRWDRRRRVSGAGRPASVASAAPTRRTSRNG
jgi:cell division protein FtsW